MILVLLEVVHFTGDDFLKFGGTLRWGLQQLLQLANDSGLLAVSQAMQDSLQPFLGLGSPGAMQRLRHRVQVLPGMMKIERLDCLLESILSQIPQPHRSIHDQIDHLRPGQSPAQGLLMHPSSKFHRGGFRRCRHRVFLQKQSPSRGLFHALLQPVDHRRFDLPPLHPLRSLLARSGSPVRTPLPRHPAVHHDHQAKGRLEFPRPGRRQHQCLSPQSQALHLLVNAAVTDWGSPRCGHRLGLRVGTHHRGGVSQTRLQLRRLALVGLQSPGHSGRADPLFLLGLTTVTGLQLDLPRHRVQLHLPPASVLQRLAGWRTLRRHRIALLLQPFLQ